MFKEVASVLAYSKTYEEFCDDINKGQIVSAIVTALNRRFSDSEKRALLNLVLCKIIRNSLMVFGLTT